MKSFYFPGIYNRQRSKLRILAPGYERNTGLGRKSSSPGMMNDRLIKSLAAFPFRAFKHYCSTTHGFFNAGVRKALSFLIFILEFSFTMAMAQTDVPPKTIRVVMDNDYAPYAFQSDEGKLQGILVDQWQAWEEKTGIRVEIHGMDWDEGLRRMRLGEFDVIDGIVETAERLGYFDFSPAYNTIEASIYFRKEISGITDLASLKGFSVGVKAGDQHIGKLKANGSTALMLFQNNEAIIEAAKEHIVRVFVVDDPSALYLLNKAGIEKEFRHSAPVFRDQLRRAVRKGNTNLLSTISEGFAAIDPTELKQINEKWFGRVLNRYEHYLPYLTYAACSVAVAILVIVGLGLWNDTLRKKVLQRTAALSESEQRFRQIAENIHQVFWLIDMSKKTMLYVSPNYEAVWGRSCESLYREPFSFFETIHPEDRPRVLALVEKDHKQDFEVEYQVVQPAGAIRWIWDRRFLIKDPSGNFYRIAGIAEDITERKLAEDKLRESERQLAEAQRLAHIGSWELDLRTKAVNWSDELYNIFGLQPGEIDPAKDAMSFVTTEDRDIVLNTVYSAIQKKESYSFFYRILRRNGEERIIHSCGYIASDDDGNPIKMFGTSQDITERKQAEDELRLAYQRLSYHVENTPLAVIEWDKDLFIKRWSKRAEEIFGWHESESLEKNVYDPEFPLIYIEDLHSVDTINEQLMKGIVSGNLSINRNYTKEGKVIYCEWHNSVLKDEHGNVLTILSLVQDITERKKTEETLNQSYEEIRKLTAHLQNIREDERIAIAREIHDELGQQLTVLKMEAKGLNKNLKNADEGIKRKIGDIIDLLDTMAKSVRRISSELRPSLLYNLGLVAAIEWHLKEFEKRSGIKFILNEPKEELEIPEPIKNGLFRIFQESVTNVNRHANATIIKVILEQKDQQLILSIEDNGQGFEKEKIYTKQTLGILGMKERSQMMGGIYEINSIPGEGTMVIVAVPYTDRI